MVTTDAFVSVVDSSVRDAGRDARAPGDTGPADAFAAVDMGVMNDTGVTDDTGAMDDAGVADDAFVENDAFSALDAFSATDAGRDAFVGTDAFTAMDAGRDAPVASDAGRDAFASDANRDAFSGPDAFHGDAFLPACAPATHLVINEIDYDMPGAASAPDSAEFIEIYNPTAAPIALAGFEVVLVNGAASSLREYGRVALTGTLAAGGYAVITAPAASGGAFGVTLPGTATRFVFSGAGTTDRIQNGSPDAVVLMNGSTVIDVAAYEGTVARFLPPSGATPEVILTESGSIGEDLVVDGERSLSRRPSGCDRDMPMTDWYVTVPTPGAAN